MSEESPEMPMRSTEYPQFVSVIDEKVLSRLQRIGDALGVNLIDAFGEQIGAFADTTYSTLSWKDFAHVMQLLGLRAESIALWEEDYFNDEFETTVRIARERGSYFDPSV